MTRTFVTPSPTRSSTLGALPQGETGMQEPQDSMLIANARIVLADRVIEHGWLACDDGKIIEIGEGQAPERGEDAGGDLVLPGLVELHTDHLEAHYGPRPTVYWDPVAAVV